MKVATRLAAADGFVLIAVLWLVAALAACASVYSVYVINTASAFGAYDDGLKAEGLVSAAVELAAYQLSGKPQTHPTRGQFDFRMGQAKVGVEFRSEAGRIDLNVASKELLAGLFAVLGAKRADATKYAARIVAWRSAPTKGQDGEEGDYQKAGVTYAPRGDRFPHVAELSLLLDIPSELLEQALPFLTVYSGLEKVNVVDALPEVIAALPGMARERVSGVIAQQRIADGDGKALLPLLGAAQAFATTETGRASRVKVYIAFDDGVRMTSEVVILVFEEGAAPYSVLSWRDNVDEPSPGALRVGAR